jgi:hypothetical protein
MTAMFSVGRETSCSIQVPLLDDLIFIAFPLEMTCPNRLDQSPADVYIRGIELLNVKLV